MKTLNKISALINKVFELLAVVCVVIFILSMLYQIMSRNFFPKYVTSWADPLCRYSFIWSVYFAAIVVTSKGKHIAVTLLPDALHGTAKKVLTLLTSLVFIIVLVFITRSGFMTVEAVSRRRLDAFPISAGWLFGAVPVFSIFAAFQLIVKTIADIRNVGEEVEVKAK